MSRPEEVPRHRGRDQRGGPEDPRELVCLRRADLGLLLAAALAVLARLEQSHPAGPRVWDLGEACTAAEAALLGQETDP